MKMRGKSNREGKKWRKQRKGKNGNQLQPKLESAPKNVVKNETRTGGGG